VNKKQKLTAGGASMRVAMVRSSLISVAVSSDAAAELALGIAAFFGGMVTVTVTVGGCCARSALHNNNQDRPSFTNLLLQ
jgi:hypothetical protein